MSHLPASLVRLELGGNFDHTLDALPASLASLVFRDHRIGDDDIEQCEQRLPPHDFDVDEDGDDPSATSSLTGSGGSTSNTGRFNRAIELLPASLTELYLSRSFNSSVDRLPSSLKTLQFGPSFNRSVTSLPASLETLIFSRNFDQTVDALRVRCSISRWASVSIGAWSICLPV